MVRALLAAALLAWMQAAAADARLDYVLNCQGCHLADGSGAAGKVPDLRGTFGRFLSVPEGRAFVVRVPGVRNAPLDDAKLARLLNWMLPTFSAETAPQDFLPFTTDEVTRLRRDALEDVGAQRAKLLAAAAALAD